MRSVFDYGKPNPSLDFMNPVRLGWHTDATEETQYIIAGTGELHMEDGSTYQVDPGVFLPFQRP